MLFNNRRKHFLVQKGLQFRYILYIVATLLIVSTTAAVGIYFGIWGSVLKSFSDDEVRATMITASRIYEYEQARQPDSTTLRIPTIRLFKETNLLSERQKEIIQQILDETNKRLLIPGILLLVFIGWGSIFLTHKVAGPLFRFGKSFQSVKDGDLSVRINLRKWDEAKNVADDFNQMVETLDNKISGMKTISQKTPAESSLAEIREELSKFKNSHP